MADVIPFEPRPRAAAKLIAKQLRESGYSPGAATGDDSFDVVSPRGVRSVRMPGCQVFIRMIYEELAALMPGVG